MADTDGPQGHWFLVLFQGRSLCSVILIESPFTAVCSCVSSGLTKFGNLKMRWGDIVTNFVLPLLISKTEELPGVVQKLLDRLVDSAFSRQAHWELS